MLDPATATVEYCRRARRIRASFYRSPSLRQHALGQLASQRNAQLRPMPSFPVAQITENATTPAVERGFSAHALERLQPFGFSYSDRVELLNAAERIGISRFRGNLILALHEHRMRSTEKPVILSAKASSTTSSFLVILAVEILIVGVFVAACMR